MLRTDFNMYHKNYITRHSVVSIVDNSCYVAIPSVKLLSSVAINILFGINSNLSKCYNYDYYPKALT